MRTYTGRDVDPFHLTVNDIDLKDICRGLSHVCRFAGQLPFFYSVAQHSMMVGNLLPDHLKLHGYLHDAAEAYIGDLSRVIKHDDRLSGYRELEHGIQTAIAVRFGLWLSQDDIQLLKDADDLAAVFERWTMQLGRTWDAGAIFQSTADSVLPAVGFAAMVDRVPMFWAPWSPNRAYQVLSTAIQGRLR